MVKMTMTEEHQVSLRKLAQVHRWLQIRVSVYAQVANLEQYGAVTKKG